MADEKKLPTVREHADALIAGMVADGKILPDADAAARAAGMPTFSKGTATLDPNTGQPVAPKVKTPEFTEGSAIAVPEDAPVGGAPDLRTKEAIIASIAPPDAATAAAPPAQAAGAAAAEAAAEQALAQAADEYEEFEFEDPDLEGPEGHIKYPIRVPKNYLETAKRGYGRRAAYDRAIRWLKEAEPVLREMVEDGRIRQVLPLIQAAMGNQAYGDYVTQGFQRLQQGLPLIEQARQEAAAAGAAPAPTGAEFDLSQDDPYFAERVRPILARQEGLQQRLDRMEAERQQAEQRQQEDYRLNTQRAMEMHAAHQDLARAYPGQCNPSLGPNDPFWVKAIALAKEAGYVDAYGIRAGIVFGGQQAHLIEQERLAATASPSAAGLRQAEERHLELARQQAAQASRAVSAGAPTPAPPPPAPQAPSTRNPDGSLKRPGDYLRESQQYIAATRA